MYDAILDGDTIYLVRYVCPPQNGVIEHREGLTHHRVVHIVIVICCTRYQWLAACRSQQQDCIVDHKLEHKSGLLAMTTTLDCHWYSVSDAEPQEQTGQAGTGKQETGMAEGGMEADQEQSKCIKVELLAVLKRTDLSTKLRKMDFREFH